MDNWNFTGKPDIPAWPKDAQGQDEKAVLLTRESARRLALPPLDWLADELPYAEPCAAMMALLGICAVPEVESVLRIIILSLSGRV